MDIRRSILWMIFFFSLLFLWNNWQMYTGQPSLFGGAPAQQAAAPQSDAPPTPDAADISVPSAQQAPVAAAPSEVPTGSAAVAASAEPVVVTTDVLRLTFDPVGARIVKAELLDFEAVGDANRPVVLLDNVPGELVYVA